MILRSMQLHLTLWLDLSKLCIGQFVRQMEKVTEYLVHVRIRVKMRKLVTLDCFVVSIYINISILRKYSSHYNSGSIATCY